MTDADRPLRYGRLVVAFVPLVLLGVAGIAVYQFDRPGRRPGDRVLALILRLLDWVDPEGVL